MSSNTKNNYYYHMNTNIPIRDDSSYISLSQNEKFFTQQCAASILNNTNRNGLRIDGRDNYQIRSPIRLQLNRRTITGSSTTGSTTASNNNNNNNNNTIAICTCQWGSSTRVNCTVSGELVPPLHSIPTTNDNSNTNTNTSSRHGSEGSIIISVDISPSASTRYRQCNPSVNIASGGSNNKSSGGITSTYQRMISNRILRYLERLIIGTSSSGGNNSNTSSGIIDTESLCEIVNKWVWKLTIAVTIIDCGGNIIDASIMAAIAAIRHYRKPIVQMISTSNTPSSDTGGNDNDTDTIMNDDGIPQSSATTTGNSNSNIVPVLVSSSIKEPLPLPLQHTPLCISFAILGNSSSTSRNQNNYNDNDTNSTLIALMDPTVREELCCPTIVTLGLNKHGEICLYEFFSTGTSLNSTGTTNNSSNRMDLSYQQLRILYNAAMKQIPLLLNSLDVSLQQADEQDQIQQLQLLQQLQQMTKVGINIQSHKNNIFNLQQQQTPKTNEKDSNNKNDEIDHPLQGVPYFVEQQPTTISSNDTMEVDDAVTAAAKMINDQAEALYHRQALDYNIGHIPTSIAEDNKNTKNKNNNKNKLSLATPVVTATISKVLPMNTMKTSNKLLASMLQTVAAAETTTATYVDSNLTVDYGAMMAIDDNDNEDDNDDDDNDNSNVPESSAKMTKATKTKNTKKDTSNDKHNDDDDDDDDEDEEEVTTVQYTSEFTKINSPSSTTTSGTSNVVAAAASATTTSSTIGKKESSSSSIVKQENSNDETTNEVVQEQQIQRQEEEEEFDDLAAAIKNKSSSSAKKGKKSKSKK